MNASLSLNHHSTSQSERDNRPGLRPVPSRNENSRLKLVAPEGQLQVHTAPYRGSFSLVLSQALRAAGLGSRVMVAQFLKGGVDQGPSRSISLCGTLEWLRPDICCCINEPSSPAEAHEKSRDLLDFL